MVCFLSMNKSNVEFPRARYLVHCCFWYASMIFFFFFILLLLECKFLSQFTFCNMIVPLPKSQTPHPARAKAPPHLPHMLFWHIKILQTPSPVPSFSFFRLRGRPIFTRKHVWSYYQKRFSEISRYQPKEGRGFCKNFLRQKTCVGEGGEPGRELDVLFGI